MIAISNFDGTGFWIVEIKSFTQMKSNKQFIVIGFVKDSINTNNLTGTEQKFVI